MFPSTTLAARIEAAGAQSVREATEAVASLRPDSGAFSLPLWGGIAAWSGAMSPFTKAVGCGLAGDVDEAELAAAEDAFRANETPLRIELSTLADPSIHALLSKRGYHAEGFENVSGCPLEDFKPDARESSVAIRPCADAELDAWIDATITAFAQPDGAGVTPEELPPREVLEPVFRDMAQIASYERLVAERDGALAGTSTHWIHDGILHLFGAATLPEHRRNGVQAALLAHRVALAAERGAEFAVITTAPGSTSEHNAYRRGFRLLYPRVIWVAP